MAAAAPGLSSLLLRLQAKDKRILSLQRGGARIGGRKNKQLPTIISASGGAATYISSTRPSTHHQHSSATKSAIALDDYAYHEHDLFGLQRGEEASSNWAFLEAELRLLANAASDRAQMHAILAQQRDNWNKLFQGTLTLASFTACLLAALSASTHNVSPSLSVPALLLNAGCAAVMSVVNYFQPSQLAEEQRNAARQFKRLEADVEYALQVAPHLRQPYPTLLRDSQHRLQALDAAFPMPLTPGGLDKFPSKVTPPTLLSVKPMYPANNELVPTEQPTGLLLNGMHDMNAWDKRKCHDLQQLATRVHQSDTSMYVSWSENVVKVNKCLAIGAPLLAVSAAALNGFGLLPGATTVQWTGTLAALCSLLSAFVGSVSHDLQLGMVFEMYRNAAGHYGEVEESIHNALCHPPPQRENGLLFLHRVAYKLGRWTGDL